MFNTNTPVARGLNDRKLQFMTNIDGYVVYRRHYVAIPLYVR